MQVYKIQNYPDYELHYSDEVQLIYSKKREKYLTKFNNNLEKVIEYKKKHI